MPTTLATKEDLNFNRIVSKQFDRAAQYLKIHSALLSQIKACNNVYYFQFPVRFGGDKYEIFAQGSYSPRLSNRSTSSARMSTSATF